MNGRFTAAHGRCAGCTLTPTIMAAEHHRLPDGHPQVAGRKSMAKMTGVSAEIMVKPRCR